MTRVSTATSVPPILHISTARALQIAAGSGRLEKLGDALSPSFEGSEAPRQSILPPAARKLERGRGRLPTISRLSKLGGSSEKKQAHEHPREVCPLPRPPHCVLPTSRSSRRDSRTHAARKPPRSFESRILFPMHLDVWLPQACFRPSLPVLAPEHVRVAARHERDLRIPSPRRCCSRKKLLAKSASRLPQGGGEGSIVEEAWAFS